MAEGLLKLMTQFGQRWKRTKDALAKVNDEQREELLEEFHHVEQKHQLQREAMEVKLQLLRAEVYGEDEEVDELEQILEELAEEAQFLEQR